MKFICQTREFEQAISTVQRAVSRRSPQEALGGILIESQGDQLKLTGYNTETGIETLIDADIMTEGQTLVQARLFGDIVRRLPEESVSVELGDTGQLKIRSGNADFTINTMNAADFPALPQVDGEKSLRLSQGMLKDMIDATIFGVSTDQSRPLFQGLLLNSLGKQLDLVAIDGFRLGIQRRHFEDEELAKLKITIPGNALRELAAILEDDDDSFVSISTTSNQVLFDLDHTKITARLIAGEFMDYPRVFPQNYETEIYVARRPLLEIMDRALLMTMSHERRFPIQLVMEDSANLRVSIKTEVGAFEDHIPVQANGQLIDLSFNPMYFVDALKAIDDEIIKIDFSKETGPCVIRPQEGDAYDYLILPLRR